MTNIRPSRDDTLMATAHVWKHRSTCSRNHVGCVIAMDHRIIATGYNGAVSGMPHCDHTCNCGSIDKYGDRVSACSFDCPAHPDNGCPTTVHAEANAIVFAAAHGVRLWGATLYTTLLPCFRCAQLIVNARLARVVFDRMYRVTAGLELMTAAGVVTVQGKGVE